MKSNILQHLHRCNKELAAKPLETFKGLLRSLLRAHVCDQSMEMLSLLDEAKYTQLVLYADSISSTEYTTAAEHLLLNQFAALIRKYPWPRESVSFDPEGAAIESFLSAEHSCKRTDQRFRLYRTCRSPHEASLQRARSWISYVLGEFSFPEMYDNCGFGPGASVGVHGNATNTARKILCKSWSVTPSALYISAAAAKVDVTFWELLAKQPGTTFANLDPDVFNKAFAERVSIVDHNKITFVPKTAKIHRTIAVEPLWNGYLQKGLDEMMRLRLRRVGIDLSDQTLNQRLACEGSLDDSNGFVTIDLSSASDCISEEVVSYLLPPDWFDIMNTVRSRKYVLNGNKYSYKKFVTMGNGFCFPLETLIFASLCFASSATSITPGQDFSVYGDDIIVRKDIAPRVLQLLKVCGFKANTRKTFISGPFRESCGTDWFHGEDVRPMGLDYAFVNVASIIKFCNGARSKESWKAFFGDSLEYLESLIPPVLRFTRPVEGNVETALTVPLDIFMTSRYAVWNRDTQLWSWLEYMTSAAPDVEVSRFAGYEVALMRGAMTGSLSKCPFAMRRETSTKVRRQAYSALQSNVERATSVALIRLQAAHLPWDSWKRVYSPRNVEGGLYF